MNKNLPFSIISLKAFGDFTIALWAVQKLDPEVNRYPLVYGAHLAELHSALGSPQNTKCLQNNDGCLPALFDLRKQGWIGGMRSAIHLRDQLSMIDLPSKTTLVFDKIGWRERFIAGNWPVKALPISPNIYHAYSKLFQFELPIQLKSSECIKPRIIGIFPGSRMRPKIIPQGVIDLLINICQACDYKPIVFLLEGEDCALPSGRVEIITLPRRFADTVDAVRSVGAVISADSLAAHLSEYFRLPVFVVSPQPNLYWLPFSSLIEHRWGVFNDFFVTKDRLRKFLLHGVTNAK